jgi:hypothetical protein
MAVTHLNACNLKMCLCVRSMHTHTRYLRKTFWVHAYMYYMLIQWGGWEICTPWRIPRSISKFESFFLSATELISQSKHEWAQCLLFACTWAVITLGKLQGLEVSFRVLTDRTPTPGFLSWINDIPIAWTAVWKVLLETVVLSLYLSLLPERQRDQSFCFSK